MISWAEPGGARGGDEVFRGGEIVWGGGESTRRPPLVALMNKMQDGICPEQVAV